MTIGGFFAYGITTVTPPQIPSDPAEFTATATKFDWSGEFSFATFGFNYVFTQLSVDDEPATYFQMGIADLLGASLTIVYRWTKGLTPWGVIGFLEDAPQVSVSATGDFDPPNFFLTAIPVPYHNEP
jgi:hypothetical protein